jgi:hypothetical protein
LEDGKKIVIPLANQLIKAEISLRTTSWLDKKPVNMEKGHS